MRLELKRTSLLPFLCPSFGVLDIASLCGCERRSTLTGSKHCSSQKDFHIFVKRLKLTYNDARTAFTKGMALQGYYMAFSGNVSNLMFSAQQQQPIRALQPELQRLPRRPGATAANQGALRRRPVSDQTDPPAASTPFHSPTRLHLLPTSFVRLVTQAEREHELSQTIRPLLLMRKCPRRGCLQISDISSDRARLVETITLYLQPENSLSCRSEPSDAVEELHCPVHTIVNWSLSI
ncbi:hypothetical protein BKA93DRAFT_803327 [Sparassis latifolia]